MPLMLVRELARPARDGLRLLFDGYTLDVRASLDQPPLDTRPPQILEVYPLGQQLSFYAGASVKNVGDVLSSVTGPGGGARSIEEDAVAHRFTARRPARLPKP
jgi:hypothetical protein